MSLEKVLSNMKAVYEAAILSGEEASEDNPHTTTQSVIRSQTLIGMLHNYLRDQLLLRGVKESNIFIKDKEKQKEEVQLTGALKQKKQDLCIFPISENGHALRKRHENIDFGELKNENKTDEYGKDFTEKIISINIRSQLSSLRKNKDTLFERSFAEPLNLHLRCNKMVLGEVFLIPVFEYDDKEMKKNKVKLKKPSFDMKYLDKYLLEYEENNANIKEIEDQIRQIKSKNGGRAPNNNNYKDQNLRKLREEFLNLRENNAKLIKRQRQLRADVELGLTIRGTIQRYINFFSSINKRTDINSDFYKYERCVLLIVDFSTKGNPRVYSNTSDLQKDGLVSTEFNTELSELNLEDYLDDLLNIYKQRFPNVNII